MIYNSVMRVSYDRSFQGEESPAPQGRTLDNISGRKSGECHRDIPPSLKEGKVKSGIEPTSRGATAGWQTPSGARPSRRVGAAR